MIECYVGLGSNLAAPHRQLTDAVAALGRLRQCRLVAISPVYRSSAIGPGNQPDYLNAAVKLNTGLRADSLLELLHTIEAQQGRERSVRWGARSIDLDLLLFGSQTIEMPALQVPHPRILQRNFVLFPLLDLEPALTLPDGRRLLPAALALGWRGLCRLPDRCLQGAATRHEQPALPD